MPEDMGDRERLQQLAYEAQAIQGQGQGMQEQLALLGATAEQLNAALESLRSLGAKKGNEGTGYVPVGAGVFAPASVSCESVLVDVGSGVLVEKPLAEALEFVENRLREALGAQERAQLGAVRAGQRLRAIDMEARGLIEKMRGSLPEG